MMGCMRLKDTDEITQQQLVISAFNASNAKVLKSTLLCQGVIDGKVWNGNKPTIEQIEVLGEDLIRELETKYIPIERRSDKSDTVTKYSVRIQTAQHRYVKLTLWHESLDDNGTGQTYIKYELTQDLSYDDIYKGAQRLQNTLIPYVDNITTMTTVIGTYKGKLTAQEAYEVSQSILQEAQAKSVVNTEKDDTVTVFGYTPLYKQYVKVNNQKANLSILMYYNDQEDRTYIMLQSIP